MSESKEEDRNRVHGLRAECALKFQDLESCIKIAGTEQKQALKRLDQIHELIKGTNGDPGIGEKIRNLNYLQKKQDKSLDEIMDYIKNRQWRLWQKFAAVLITLCAVGGLFIQLVKMAA